MPRVVSILYPYVSLGYSIAYFSLDKATHPLEIG